MPHRVLIADDDSAIRSLVRAWLMPDSDIDELRLCDRDGGGAGVRFYDVVVLDVMMPGLTGVDVCRQLSS